MHFINASHTCPSQTVYLLMSGLPRKQYVLEKIVLHCRLHSSWRLSFDVSYLRSIIKTVSQQQATVKLYRDFSSHQKSQAHSPE